MNGFGGKYNAKRMSVDHEEELDPGIGMSNLSNEMNQLVKVI
jgi:hypothetical protein